MGVFKEAVIVEERVYDNPLNPIDSDYVVILKITSTEAVVDPETGDSLSKILETIQTALAESQNPGTVTTDGLLSEEDREKLNGIETGANRYIHPLEHDVSMITGLSTFAISGDYNDLQNKPVLNPFIIQEEAPVGDETKLWIHSSTGVAYYWNGAQWKPLAGTQV